MCDGVITWNDLFYVPCQGMYSLLKMVFFSLLDPRSGFELGFIKSKSKLIYLSYDKDMGVEFTTTHVYNPSVLHQNQCIPFKQ